MHEHEFSQALIPRKAVVLGLALRPYSLAHELWLTSRNNRLIVSRDQAKPGPNEEIKELQSALIEAVLVCHHRHAEIVALDSDWLLGIKIAIWRIRIRKLLRRDLALELGKFLDYRGRALEGPPLEDMPNRAGAPPSHPPGAPFVLRLKQFLMLQLELSEEEALNFSLAQAQWEWAAWGESEGFCRIRNEQDDFMIRLKAEVERRVAGGEDFQKAFVQVREELEGQAKPAHNAADKSSAAETLNSQPSTDNPS